MTEILPIDSEAMHRVTEATRHYIGLAAQAYGRRLEPIPVLFDLKGRNAGMYRVRGKLRCIRYNPWLFAKYFDDNLANTVPHEVAHYVCDMIFGLGRIRPHGPEWRAVMQLFGVEARRTCSYDLAGIPQRRQRRFRYRCDCREYQLTSRRHNRIVKQECQYLCKACGQTLTRVD